MGARRPPMVAAPSVARMCLMEQGILEIAWRVWQRFRQMPTTGSDWLPESRQQGALQEAASGLSVFGTGVVWYFWGPTPVVWGAQVAMERSARCLCRNRCVFIEITAVMRA